MKWHQKGVPEVMSLSILFTRVRDKKECTRCMLLEAYIWNAPGSKQTKHILGALFFNAPGSNILNTFWMYYFLMHQEVTT